MKRSARSASTIAKIAIQEGSSSAPRQKKLQNLTPQRKPSISIKRAKLRLPGLKADENAKLISFSSPTATISNLSTRKAPRKAIPPKNKKLEIDAESAVDAQEDVSPYFVPESSSKTLNREFYDQDCIPLCKALLGTVLVRRIKSTGEILKGIIVETEAYPGGDDKASQSYQGKRTPRNEAMFLDPGTAYVYFTYGMYYCYNISSKGEGAACLIRAVEPLEDYETMHNFRKPSKKKNEDSDKIAATFDNPKKRLKLYELANGPSKLCMAFDIRRDNCDKIDMANSDELWLELSEDEKFRNRKFEICEDKRIGIDSTPPEARNKRWRFFVKDSLAESRAKVSEIKKRLAI